jgi:protein-tyrosine phosphatase
MLRDCGFDVLVLCAMEFQAPAHEYPGVYVVHAPNDDSVEFPLTREKLKIAMQAAHVVADEVSHGRQVLVTCAAGLNRSGLVSALALHFLFGWAGDACIHRVRKKRRVKSGMNSLCNGEFVQVLQRLPTQMQTVPSLPPPVQASFQL